MTGASKLIIVNNALADVKDTLQCASENKDVDFTLDDLVGHDAFVRSLADKKTRALNIENLFEQNLRPMLGLSPGSEPDDALLIAENSDKVSFATTTVLVRAEGSPKKSTDVHILLNKKLGRALIVGEGAQPSLKKAFAKAGIRYVDRNAGDSLADIRQGVADILGTENSEPVRQAFAYRNQSQNLGAPEDLAEALASKTNEPLYPKYIVKRPPSAFK